MRHSIDDLKKQQEKDAAWMARAAQSWLSKGYSLDQHEENVTHMENRHYRAREKLFEQEYRALSAAVRLASDKEFENVYETMPNWYMHEWKYIYERERRLDRAWTPDKVPGCLLEEAEAAMIEGLKLQGVDAVKVKTEIGFWRNREWLTLRSWKSSRWSKSWLPALSWSFGCGTPTKWSAAICLAA